MYALVLIDGKQYKAEAGSRIRVDKMASEPGEVLHFDKVLLTSDGAKVAVGSPYVQGVTVRAVVEGHERARKVLVVKFKRRKDYRKKVGHRQSYTLIRVEAIEGAQAG